MLIQNYIPKNHIIVLMSDGNNPGLDRKNIIGNYDSSPTDFGGDQISDVNYSATKNNIECWRAGNYATPYGISGGDCSFDAILPNIGITNKYWSCE